MTEISPKQLKDNLLSFVESGQNERVPPIILAILDEAIEAVYEGRSTINGRAAQTEKELIFCVVQHMQSATNIYSDMVKRLKEEFPNDEIKINFRGQTFRP